jgi:hypothetical protein
VLGLGAHRVAEHHGAATPQVSGLRGVRVSGKHLHGRSTTNAKPLAWAFVMSKCASPCSCADRLSSRIECTSVMSGLGGAPAVLPGVDAGRCGRRTGRGSGRCDGTAGPQSGRPRRGGVGPFAWVPADLGYGGRGARRSSMWRAWPSARVARRPPGEWRRARRRSGLAGKGKELLVPRLHP